MPSHAPQEDFTSAIHAVQDSDSDRPASDSEEASRTSDSSNSESSSEEERAGDSDLRRIREAIAPQSADATPEDLRKALEDTQDLLFKMRGKLDQATSRNGLLEGQIQHTKGGKSKKLGNLTEQELKVAAQQEEIRFFGRKYAGTHSLWINSEIFPLSRNPKIDLLSAERWLSPLSKEKGVKTELFKFIPKESHKLMAYKTFGAAFTHGVSCIRSEMASDIKGSAGAIFGLNAMHFSRGYDRTTEADCRSLIVAPNGKFTKFAPVLFPRPNNPQPNDFLKCATLVRVLRVALFGKASINGGRSSGPKPKAKIWNLNSTTAGMIANAAVVAIFVLSGDPNLYPKGEKTSIPYTEWQAYYYSRLHDQTPWARSVFKFFNDALFPATSSGAVDPLETNNVNDANEWEEEFELAFAAGMEFSVAEQHQAQPPPEPEVPAAAPAAPARPAPSLSTAIQNLSLLNTGAPRIITLAASLPGPAFIPPVPALSASAGALAALPGPTSRVNATASAPPAPAPAPAPLPPPPPPPAPPARAPVPVVAEPADDPADNIGGVPVNTAAKAKPKPKPKPRKGKGKAAAAPEDSDKPQNVIDELDADTGSAVSGRRKTRKANK